MRNIGILAGAALTFALLGSPGAQADYERGIAAWLRADYATAFSELMPAAENGHADAEELIGVLYALGLGGVEQDYEKALAWYLRAAEHGHAGAQSGVGWYYEVGLGGAPVDLVRAHMWYAISAVGGDVDAAVSVTEVEKKMTREQIAAAQAAAREWMAKK